jgi:hypothetical protein
VGSSGPDFKLRTPPVEAKREIDQTPRSAGKKPEHTSQSEHDWAYAKRALARGDNPEEIIRRIADYRADDKHDPEYYARHTVAKAQAALGRTPAVNTAPEGKTVQSSPQRDFTERE